MYTEKDIQKMLDECSLNMALADAVTDGISNERDKSAVRRVINEKVAEFFYRYDSDVCEQFITSYERACEMFEEKYNNCFKRFISYDEVNKIIKDPTKAKEETVICEYIDNYENMKLTLEIHANKDNSEKWFVKQIYDITDDGDKLRCPDDTVPYELIDKDEISDKDLFDYCKTSVRDYVCSLMNDYEEDIEI